MRSAIRLTLAMLGVLTLAAAHGHAQSAYPNRPVRVIIPVPAGSAPDLLTRLFGQALFKQWGQPFVAEYRPGASQNIAAEAVYRAEPDGYTLYTAPPPSLAVNQYLFPKLNFDPQAFAPVTVLAEAPNVLVTRTDLGVSDVAGLVALAKAKAGGLTYGSTGVGGTPHLTAEAFKARAGVDLVHVPFKGTVEILAEMLGGRIDMAFLNMIDVYPQIKAGKLKALAIGSAAPSPGLPGVPTLASIWPGFVSVAWFAVMAPPKTPDAITKKLADGIREAFQSPDAAKVLSDLRSTAVLNSPVEAGAYIRADSERWRDVITANHIRAE